MDYTIVIPTHNRADVIQKKSLPLLKRLGIPASKITLVVSNAEQKELYQSVPKDLYKELLVLPSKGIGDVKNKITAHYPAGKKLVIFEDDIRDLRHMSADGKKLISVSKLEPIIKKGFDLCKEKKTILWGIYAVPNAFFMKKEVSFDLKFIIGTCYGLINDKSIHLKTNVKEDYELSLIVWKKYGAIVRFNNIVAMRKAYPDKGQGGLEDLKERKERTEKSVEYLLKTYPDLIYESKKTKLGLREIQMKRVKNEELKGGITPLQVAEVAVPALALGVPLAMIARNASKTKPLFGGITKQPIVPQSLPENEMTSTRVVRPGIRDRERYKRLRDDLLRKLQDITVSKIPKPSETSNTNRGNVIGTIGRTMTFGFGDNRQGWNFYATNKKYPEVFEALVKFGNAVVPKGWRYQGITLNHGVKAKKHKDKKNVGESVIVGFGDYTGGELKVWDGNDKNPKALSIKDDPLMFNGGNLYHQTTPFKGDRYTIIFYKQAKKPKKGEVGIGRGHTTSEELPEPLYPEEGAVFA